MRRFLVDLGTVALDLFRVLVVTVAALTAVLLAGMAVQATAGATAALYVINEGLAATFVGLILWLTFVGRRRYDRAGGRR